MSQDLIVTSNGGVDVLGSLILHGNNIMALSAGNITINSQSGNYILAIGDAFNAVSMTSVSANTLTVPLNSVVAFPIGTEIRIEQDGIGQTTIAAAGGGVIINSRGGALKLAGQYAAASLFKTNTNVWTLVGDITT